MIELAQKPLGSLVSLLHSSKDLLEPFLKQLDPSLFQNILLGILAIFIPFAIVFLTDILNSKKERRSEFEKMVLNDEVLGTKKIFWFSIIGIVFFSFFSGTETSFLAKILAIVAAVVLVLLFWQPFKKILRFSEGYKPEFEIPFLKKLNFSTVFWFNNKNKSEKLFRAWNSFWSEKSEISERDFTEVFISHIDGAIKHDEFDIAVQLAQIYTNNIEKRDSLSISHEVLPKVFVWNEIFWNEEQLWLKSYKTEDKIQNFFSQKYFPTFKGWVLTLYKKLNAKKERFWNWNYFENEMFQTIIKISLKDSHRSYQLFSTFKKHVEENETKLNRMEDGEERERYWLYITGLFSSFCPTFFNEIRNATSSYSIWEGDFPAEWKITVANKDNKISRIILHEFLKWSEGRIFKEIGDEKNDESLTEVVNGIFPNIHSSLFVAFFRLLVSDDIKYILNKEPNFYILNSGVSWSSSVEESEEETDRRITEMMQAQESSQKEETIQLILDPNYFAKYWEKLKITLDDSNKSEWESASIEKRNLMLGNARREKLEKIKTEVESDEVKEVCKDSGRKESYRKDLLELINLLLAKI